MNIRDAIKNFNEQFGYEPEILNPEKLMLNEVRGFVVAGMGGSNLVADLLKIRDPYLDITVHRNYGLPPLLHDEFQKRLLIANSYSGNTEETIDSLEQAVKRGYSAAVIATGGKLIERAKELGLPYIQMPSTGIQPRSALGYNLKAVLKMMGREDLMNEAAKLKDTVNPAEQESAGKELAERIKGRVPVIYSSERNLGIAYNWKIKFNETGKIPAFYNVFPELNHNEMTGFDEGAVPNRVWVERNAERKKLNAPFHFIFLQDAADHPKIRKRMEVTEKLYCKLGLPVEVLDLIPNQVAMEGNSVWSGSIFHKIFSSLVLADWAAYYTALGYGLEPEEVPMVETFKKLMRN